MTLIVPGEDETPFEALMRIHGTETSEMFEWDESEFVPATDEEMRDGLRDAMATAREKGWIPETDPGCQCLMCRMFRSYVS